MVMPELRVGEEDSERPEAVWEVKEEGSNVALRWKHRWREGSLERLQRQLQSLLLPTQCALAVSRSPFPQYDPEYGVAATRDATEALSLVKARAGEESRGNERNELSKRTDMLTAGEVLREYSAGLARSPRMSSAPSSPSSRFPKSKSLLGESDLLLRGVRVAPNPKSSSSSSRMPCFRESCPHPSSS